VHVGDKCYGTADDGSKHYGTAVMTKSGNGDGNGNAGGNEGVPHYCKTDVGVLGPYPNDGSVHVGDKCYGTADDGSKHYGTAVMSKDAK
jgi:hypothetical protein